MNDVKIVLTLGSNYLGHWTVYDALRELYQNIFDRENEDSNALWYSEYDDGALTLTNANTILERKTLVLGVSSKRENKDAVGKFGEGYKLAILVLLREGLEVEILTGHEKWTFSLEHSNQFGMKMLTVKIGQLPKLKYTTSLKIHITGLSKKLWSSYSQYNLKIQKKVKMIKTPHCDVLLDKRNRSKIFVGSLYICKYVGNALYGYNFAPHVFPLGRDRNIIEGFNANWEASRALADASINNSEVLSELVDNMNEGDDSRYLHNFTNSASVLVEALWTKFSTSYPNKLPVDSQWRKEMLEKQYLNISLVIVKEREYEILKQSNGFKHLMNSLDKRPPAPTPEEVVCQFYDNYLEDSSDIIKTAYASNIMAESVNWKVSE